MVGGFGLGIGLRPCNLDNSTIDLLGILNIIITICIILYIITICIIINKNSITKFYPPAYPGELFMRLLKLMILPLIIARFLMITNQSQMCKP